MAQPPVRPRSSVQPFAVRLGFEGGRAVVSVRGEVDVATAPAVAAVLDGACHLGHHDVVVDLAALDFIDCAGLGVLAGTAAALRSRGGELEIRSASATVLRLLQIIGLDRSLRITEPSRPEAPTVPILGSDADDVLDGALALVVALASASIGSVAGATVSLPRGSEFATVASTGEDVTMADAAQYSLAEGPCVDTIRLGRAHHLESAPDDARWPAFSSRVAELGLGSVYATPLLGGSGPIGSLNLYARTPGAFGDQAERDRAALLAASASALLDRATNAGPPELFGSLLEDALGSRTVVGQAQGILMAREGLSAEDAYDVLRRASRSTSAPLRVHAEQVVRSASR